VEEVWTSFRRSRSCVCVFADMFKGIREQWRALEDCVVRPPRAEYTERELVGGRSGKFAVGLASGKREDYDITNKRGQTLKCR